MSSSIHAALRRIARLALVPLLVGSIMVAGTQPASAAAYWRTTRSAAFIHLIESIPAPNWVNMSYGSRQPRVVYVQAALGVPRTGYYGLQTYRAVWYWQVAMGLPATAVVDIWTMRFLVYRLVVLHMLPLKPTPAVSHAAAILAEARAVAVGARYVAGATGPTYFDCSGYVGYVLRRAIGASLPRTSYQMRAALPRISGYPLPGDLVFVYNGVGGAVHHVAIYAGNGYWWEASNPSSGVGLHRAWSSSISYARV